MKKQQNTSIQNLNHPNKVCLACGERLSFTVEKLPCGLHLCSQPKHCVKTFLFERDLCFCPVCAAELPKDAYGKLSTPEPTSTSQIQGQLDEPTGGAQTDNPPSYNSVVGPVPSEDTLRLSMEKHDTLVTKNIILKACYHRDTSSLICRSKHNDKGRQLTVLKLNYHRLWVSKTVVWDELRNACPTEAETSIFGIALNEEGFYVNVRQSNINRVEVLDINNDFSFKKLRNVETSQVSQDFPWVLLAMNNTLVILTFRNQENNRIWKKAHLYHNEQLVTFIDIDIRLDQVIVRTSFLLCYDRYLLLKFDKNVIAIVDMNANNETLPRYVELEGGSIEDVGDMAWVNVSKPSGILFISSENKPHTTSAFSLDLDRVHNGQSVDRLQIEFLERMGVNQFKLIGTVDNQSLLCREHPLFWEQAKYSIISLKFQK